MLHVMYAWTRPYALLLQTPDAGSISWEQLICVTRIFSRLPHGAAGPGLVGRQGRRRASRDCRQVLVMCQLGATRFSSRPAANSGGATSCNLHAKQQTLLLGV